MFVTCRSSIETAERIELVFGVYANFGVSYGVVRGVNAPLPPEAKKI